MHELIESETGNGPTNPHENENQQEDFNEKYRNTQDCEQVWTVLEGVHAWEIVTSKEQNSHYCG
jgi:hypothetical protein